MNAIKQARKIITEEPSSTAAHVLAQLVLSLESDSPFRLSEIYNLDMNSFKVAMAVLDEWRLDRYYAGKARLFDVSYQAVEINSAAAALQARANAARLS